jgi:hypothetical protein
MHPQYSRSMLRYLFVALLVAALIVLFPVAAKSHHRAVQLAIGSF